MHSLTKIHGGRSDVRMAALATPPSADAPKRVTRIIRDLIQGAWRRRFLILLPVILMLPISFIAATILPKAYIARSLMQLQEASRENPFSREGDASSIYRVQERFEGLRALFLSDRVLIRALGEEAQRLPAAERETRIGDLRKDLSLDLIGGDFIEVKLSGAKPEGLGKTLETVMASFLEALVPEQGGATAAELMVNARRQDLVSLTKAKEDVQRELASLLPNGPTDAEQRLMLLRARQHEKKETLTRIDAEVSRLRNVLGSPSDEQLKQEIAKLPEGPRDAGPPSGSDQPMNERTRDLFAFKSLSSLRQALSAETRDLSSDTAALDGKITRFRELQDRFAGLEKEIASAREAFESYQKRFSGTNAMRSVGVLKAPELIRIVDPPRDPATASRSRLLYFLSGIMAGGLIGLGLAFVAEKMDSRIRHADEASEIAGIPVLAMMRNYDHRSRERGGSRQRVESNKPHRLSSATR